MMKSILTIPPNFNLKVVGRLPDIGDVGGDRKAKLQNLEAEAEGEWDTKDTKKTSGDI